MTKLVMADTRSENAEMDIGRLNVRIDKVVVVVMVMVMMVTMMVVMYQPAGGGGPCGGEVKD